MSKHPTSGAQPTADKSSATPLPALFRPLALRGLVFANRVLVTPMCQYCAQDGHAVDWHFSHHGRFSLAGPGGACVEATAVTRTGRITHGCLGIYLDRHIKGLAKIVSIYHNQGIPVGIQIGHSGRKGSAATPLDGAAPLSAFDPSQAWETIAPSPVPMMDGWPTPRPMGADEIHELIDAFARAAARAVRAGFDFIEIHGAHGYLVNSFFSPIANLRDDEWGGGDIDNRMRFPLRVAEAVRASIPDSMPLFFRTSVVDGLAGGVTVADTVLLAAALKRRGVDLIDCSSGGIIGPSGRAGQDPAPGYLVPYAKAVREGADMPTMAVGLIIAADQANEIIAAGSADLVAIGRQLLEEPNFVFQAARRLGHPDPFAILPESYAFFLKRR